jgi:hypothetical protein
MSFVRQFAMERFLPEDIVDYAPGYKTALTGNARLYADDVLGAANPAHAYNAKRQLAEYAMAAKGIELRTPKNPNPFNQALGTAASVFSTAAPFMGGGGSNYIPGVEGQDATTHYGWNAPASNYEPGSISTPGWTWDDL